MRTRKGLQIFTSEAISQIHLTDVAIVFKQFSTPQKSDKPAFSMTSSTVLSVKLHKIEIVSMYLLKLNSHPWR